MARKRRKHPHGDEFEASRKRGEAVVQRNQKSASTVALEQLLGQDSEEIGSFRKGMLADPEERNPQIRKLEDDLREASKKRIFGRRKPSVERLIEFLEQDSLQASGDIDKKLLSQVVDIWCRVLGTTSARQHEIKLRAQLLVEGEAQRIENLTGREIITRLNSDYDLSLNRIGRELEMDPSHVSKIADGRVEHPREDTVRALKRLLGSYAADSRD